MSRVCFILFRRVIKRVFSIYTILYIRYTYFSYSWVFCNQGIRFFLLLLLWRQYTSLEWRRALNPTCAIDEDLITRERQMAIGRERERERNNLTEIEQEKRRWRRVSFVWTLRKLFFFQNHHSCRSAATLRKLIRRPLFPPSLIECRGETNDTELSFESFLLGISVTSPDSFLPFLSLSLSIHLSLSLSFLSPFRSRFCSFFLSREFVIFKAT